MDLQTAISPEGELLHLIHFSYKNFCTTWVIACSPFLENLTAHVPWMRTNDPRAVTCPMCLRSVIFSEANTEMMNALKLRKPQG